MERLQRLFGGGMGGMGPPHPDSPLLDSSEQVDISSLALLKMLKHGRARVPMEVMALMLGEFVDEYTVRVVNVFAMTQSGRTDVSVEVIDHVFQTNMLEHAQADWKGFMRLLPSLDVVAVSQAPSLESNPNSPLPVTTMDMLNLAIKYNKAVQEEDKLSREKLAIANVEWQDAKKHMEEHVSNLMSANIVQTLGTMLDTVVF